MSKRKVDLRPSRIAVEASLFDDVRFHRLVQLCGGDAEKAFGKWGFFVKEAQRYWKRGVLIPKEIVEIGGFGPVLEAGLGVACEDGVYAKGSKEHFAWLQARQKAGREGGKQRQAKAGKGKPPTPTPAPTPDSSFHSESQESAAPAAPLSLPAIAAHGAVAPAHDLGEPESLSPTDLPAKSDDLDLPRAVPKPKLDGKLVQAAVAAYCEAFTERYAVRPPVGPKEVGVIRRLLARIGSLERFRELVQAYVQMPGDRDWFVKRTHDLVTLETNVNQVVVALSRGDPTTSVGWERFWERIDAEESGGTKALRDAVAATS